MNRTPDEIIDRIADIKEDDFFGAETNNLVAYLPFELAKPYLDDTVTETAWTEYRTKVKSPLDSMRDYLPFAWDKANNCRGLSAGRSLMHIRAWLWLAGYDELVDRLPDYEYYGKPQLVMCSVLVAFNWAKVDNSVWTNGEDEPPIKVQAKEKLIAEFTGYALTALRVKVTCMECGATSALEAKTKCIAGGDKDDCPRCQLWPD